MHPSKKFIALTLPLSTMFFVGCMDLVEIEVLRPAEVDFPADIQTLIVVDRSAPKDGWEELLSGVEGLGSAEGILADKEARSSAIQAIKDGLNESPRFDVIDLEVNTKAYGTSIFDKAMTPNQAMNLCIQVQCDGIVSLEAFDSDTQLVEVIDVIENMDGDNDAEEMLWYLLTRTTNTVATWRVYDGLTGLVMDEVREHRVGSILDAEGDSIEEALAGIPDGRSIVKGLSIQSAEEYVTRIAPMYETVYRHLYSIGSDAIEAGSLAFDSGDMNGAIQIWESCAQSTWTEEQGRCTFNLAVSHESRGNIEEAYRLATRAHELLGAVRTGNYVTELASLR